jgi:hypothetical protein
LAKLKWDNLSLSTSSQQPFPLKKAQVEANEEMLAEIRQRVDVARITNKRMFTSTIANLVNQGELAHERPENMSYEDCQKVLKDIAERTSLDKF